MGSWLGLYSNRWRVEHLGHLRCVRWSGVCRGRALAAFADGDCPLMNSSSIIYLHLPILIAVISLVYSATRFERWSNILREAVRWGFRMATFLCGIAVVLYVLSLVI